MILRKILSFRRHELAKITASTRLLFQQFYKPSDIAHIFYLVVNLIDVAVSKSASIERAEPSCEVS